MNILENKIKEISDTVKTQEDCSQYIIEYIEEVLNIASSNYIENDLKHLLDKYKLRDYICENKIDFINKKIILPVKNDILQNKDFDYKVFMILKLLANNEQNNIITKFILTFNKDKILKEYNISEKDFIKGFNNLLLLGILKDEDTYYKIRVNKYEGYYLTLDRDICNRLVKESNRTVKTYIFMRDYLKGENDIWRNAKGNINYKIINYGTGYKDEKSLKIIIDKLIDLDLIERIENKDGYKTIYTYEIVEGTLIDYMSC
ncbi:MAG: hypothetical protein RSC84_03370 [Peptostreptococcaceae bacterium]